MNTHRASGPITHVVTLELYVRGSLGNGIAGDSVSILCYVGAYNLLSMILLPN